MKLGKMLLAALGASVLLGALVSSASARNLEATQTTSALWTTFHFEGIFGIVVCEVRLSGSFHRRTMVKAAGSLIGYITAATVLRCERGGATVRQESLPWHRRYRAFAGTLPSVTGFTENLTGSEWTIREPFGITCTVLRETTEVEVRYLVRAGTVTTATTEGTGDCSGLATDIWGITTNVGTITIRLI